MLLFLGSLLLLGEFSISVFPVERFLVFAADEKRTRYRVTSGITGVILVRLLSMLWYVDMC